MRRRRRRASGVPTGALVLGMRLAMRLALLLAWAAGCSLANAATPPIGGSCAAVGSGPLRVDGADLVLHDGIGPARARWPLRDVDGRPGVPIAVCPLQPRRSFVVIVAGWHELWEISTDPAAAPIFDGLVHDYRMGEAIARPGYLGVRRVRLQRPWLAAWADGRVPWLLGVESGAPGDVAVLHLDVRRVVGRLPLAADGGWPVIAGQRFPWGPGPAAP